MAFFRSGSAAPKPFIYLAKNGPITLQYPAGVYSPNGIDIYTIRWSQDDRALPVIEKEISGIGRLGYRTREKVTYFVLSTTCEVKKCPNLPNGIYPAGVTLQWVTPPAPRDISGQVDWGCADWQNCPSVEIRVVN